MITTVQKLHRKKGFTLVEMLIGVLIFSLSLVALMTISSRGLKAARGAEKQVIADYLAIEAIEVVRNIRDESFLKNLSTTTWELVFEGGDFLNDEGCFDGTGSCNFYIDGDPFIKECNNGCNVWLDESNYYYFQTEDDSTPSLPIIDSGFDREIRIQQVSPGQIFVLVKVTWDGGEVNFTENLFLWQ